MSTSSGRFPLIQDQQSAGIVVAADVADAADLGHHGAGGGAAGGGTGGIFDLHRSAGVLVGEEGPSFCLRASV